MIAKSLVLASAILLSAVASVAHAASRQGIIAFAPVREQIRRSAVRAGLWNGDRPQLKLRYNKDKTKVNASVSSMSRFTGAPEPLPEPVRQVDATAKFRIQTLPDGKLATGVRQRGGVWQRIYRASSPTASAGSAQE